MGDSGACNDVGLSALVKNLIQQVHANKSELCKFEDVVVDIQDQWRSFKSRMENKVKVMNTTLDSVSQSTKVDVRNLERSILNSLNRDLSEMFLGYTKYQTDVAEDRHQKMLGFYESTSKYFETVKMLESQMLESRSVLKRQERDTQNAMKAHADAMRLQVAVDVAKFQDRLDQFSEEYNFLFEGLRKKQDELSSQIIAQSGKLGEDIKQIHSLSTRPQSSYADTAPFIGQSFRSSSSSADMSELVRSSILGRITGAQLVVERDRERLFRRGLFTMAAQEKAVSAAQRSRSESCERTVRT